MTNPCEASCLPATLRVTARSQAPGWAGCVLCPVGEATLMSGYKPPGLALWSLGQGVTPTDPSSSQPAAGFCPKPHESVTALDTEDHSFPLETCFFGLLVTMPTGLPPMSMSWVPVVTWDHPHFLGGLLCVTEKP